MNIVKVGASGGLGVVITLGLLLLMQSLINQDLGSPEDVDRTPIGDIRMPSTDIDTRYDTPRPERPDEPDTEPPDIPEPDYDMADASMEALSLAMPGLDGGISINVGGGFTGDGEFMPIVNVAPEYPRNAAQRGIEGFVTVRFTVTAAGTTRDVEVVEAITTDGRPTTLFNRAAIRAAERFRFRPRVIDGEPVEVAGVSYRFVFEMAES